MAARRTMVRTLSGIGIGVMLSAGAALAAGTGQADAAPNIHCAGQICHNYGDQIGIGFGTYQCPNGTYLPVTKGDVRSARPAVPRRSR
ncbi:hypothetical protein LH935_07545 [Gordonia polyisoprenivorans]|uniref:hypothetical protein n=1 Tax=Gordonia polyisoprenivorans TaxID=84595 RepID=UPI0022344579|nr:hypothetical protein LH935_07545 [Gordonia polyisoprenivorans]